MFPAVCILLRAIGGFRPEMFVSSWPFLFKLGPMKLKRILLDFNSGVGRDMVWIQ